MLQQMDGESVLECEISFTYLQPGDYKETDISLEPASLTQEDDAADDASDEKEMIIFKKIDSVNFV